MGRDGWIVMIKVIQRQHGGLFLRFARDMEISVLDNSIADIEARAYDSTCLDRVSSSGCFISSQLV